MTKEKEENVFQRDVVDGTEMVEAKRTKVLWLGERTNVCGTWNVEQKKVNTFVQGLTQLEGNKI